MNNIEFAKAAESIARNLHTLYVSGGFGAPLNAKNRKRYSNNNQYNRQPERSNLINSASDDTFAFDCIGLVKGILWGFNGDKSKTYGGAVYVSNGVPDYNQERFITLCEDVSDDFTNIPVGAFLWMKGHCGIYIGNGYAVECTPKWKNCVQISVCGNHPENAKGNVRKWTKWGKFPQVDYVDETVIALKIRVDGEIKTVKAMQYKGENYIRMRDLDEVMDYGTVTWDSVNKIPTITKK